MNRNRITPTKVSSTYPYILLFFIASFIGWFWEILARWGANGFKDSLLFLVTNCRGVLHGLCVPIYGFGVLLLVIIWNLFHQRKILFYLVSILACGVLEYVTGYILELLFHHKWWDYTGAFLNIDGRICFVSVFGFGIIGATAIMIIMPRYLTLMKNCSLKLQRVLSISLLALFAIDIIYSLTKLFTN